MKNQKYAYFIKINKILRYSPGGSTIAERAILYRLKIIKIINFYQYITAPNVSYSDSGVAKGDAWKSIVKKTAPMIVVASETVLNYY